MKASPRRSGSLTESDADAQKADNLIARDFTADAPNRKWLTDITQISCQDGKLYIAPVLDCYNGEIVGLAMDDNMKKGLCIKAFESACRSQSVCQQHDPPQRPGQSVHQHRIQKRFGPAWSYPKYEWNRTLLRQCQNGKLFRHVEKGKTLQNKGGTNTDGPSQKHRVPVHHDLLQPYSDLYQQSERATACYVSSGCEGSGCLIRKFGVFTFCTILDFST